VLVLLCSSPACLARETQRLRVNVTGGVLNIVSEWGNKCLDLPGGNTNNGNLLQIWDCNGMTNQQWLFDSGSWRIQYGGDSGKCIDALGWSANGGAGTKLGLWDCNGRDSQSWGYDSNLHTVYLAHSADRSNASNANLCMDLIGGLNEDGTQIQVWNCNEHTNQAWDIRSAGPSPGPSPGPAPGPHSLSVSSMTITLSGMVAGSQNALVTYPTNPSQGQTFPLISFAHGTDAPPHVYQSLFNTVASYGFVIVAVEGFARGESLTGWKDVLHAIELCQSGGCHGTPFSYTNTGAIGLLGHSMGGGYVTAIASDGGHNIVCGASLHGSPCGRYHTEGPVIPMLYTAGSRDYIVPASVVQSVTRTCKNKCDYQLIQGVGHFPIGSSEATMVAKYLQGCVYHGRMANVTIV